MSWPELRVVFSVVILFFFFFSCHYALFFFCSVFEVLFYFLFSVFKILFSSLPLSFSFPPQGLSLFLLLFRLRVPFFPFPRSFFIIIIILFRLKVPSIFFLFYLQIPTLLMYASEAELAPPASSVPSLSLSLDSFPLSVKKFYPGIS